MAENYDVVIDYGHGADTWENGGGKGVRKYGRVFEEHTANVRLGEKLKKILEAHGLKVKLTQPAYSWDRSLAHRVKEAVEANAKVFISIHHNAGVSEAQGSCIFAWRDNSPKSQRLQDILLDEWEKAGIDLHGNGEHESNFGDWDNFYLLREMRYNPMAIVLTENGFMTNDRDFENIFGGNRGDYSDKVAEADAKGILSYLGMEYDPSNYEVAGDFYAPEKRLGEVVIGDTPMNYRAEPSLDAEILRVLPAGHGSDGNCHLYERKGHWLRLGKGWISNPDGKYATVHLYDRTPAEQPKEPEETIYRVIVDGEQVGAYAEDSNVLQQAKKAIEDGSDNIQIQEV